MKKNRTVKNSKEEEYMKKKKKKKETKKPSVDVSSESDDSGEPCRLLGCVSTR